MTITTLKTVNLNLLGSGSRFRLASTLLFPLLRDVPLPFSCGTISTFSTFARVKKARKGRVLSQIKRTPTPIQILEERTNKLISPITLSTYSNKAPKTNVVSLRSHVNFSKKPSYEVHKKDQRIKSKNLLLNKGILSKNINGLTKFQPNLAFNQIVSYQFNKNKSFSLPPDLQQSDSVSNSTVEFDRFKFQKAINLLKKSFLTMGCLISRPKFSVVYQIPHPSIREASSTSTPAPSFFSFCKGEGGNLLRCPGEDVSVLPFGCEADPQQKESKAQSVALLLEGREKNPQGREFTPKTPQGSGKRDITGAGTKYLGVCLASGLFKKTQSKKKIIIQLFYFIRARRYRYLKNFFSLPTQANLGSQAQSQGVSYFNKISHLILCRYSDKFKFLTDCLTQILGSDVELKIIRLNKPFYDSHILVQDLAIKSYKNRFVRLVSKLFRRMNIIHPNSCQSPGKIIPGSTGSLPFKKVLGREGGLALASNISGVSIRLAGRAFKQKIIPRITVKQIQKGSLTNVNVQFIEKARFIGKTRRGTYCFTVTLGHVFK